MQAVEQYELFTEIQRLAAACGVSVVVDEDRITLQPNSKDQKSHAFLYGQKVIYHATTFEEIVGFLNGWRAFQTYLLLASPEAHVLLCKSEEERWHQILLETLE